MNNGRAKESAFQSKLVKKIETLFPGSIVYITDGNYIKGFPDIIVLFENRWAALECKKHKRASHRPLQDYYISKLNKMSFARFVYPENEEEVLNDLQQTFEFRR